MSMSKKEIYEQLISDYGEQFSIEAGDYAIDNLEANYNHNALKKLKSINQTWPCLQMLFSIS